MSCIIMLIPTGTSVGLTSVSLGVIRAMERKGVRLSVLNLSLSRVPVAMRPIRQRLSCVRVLPPRQPLNR